jgi:ribosomal protein S20
MNKQQATQCVQTLLKKAENALTSPNAESYAKAAKDASIAISFMIRSGLITQ